MAECRTKVKPPGRLDAELTFLPLPLLLSSASLTEGADIVAVASPATSIFQPAAFESAIPMPLYVIEIGGEPIVVFPEGSLELAREEARSGNVTEALQEFTRDGTPLWDGAAVLEVREAVDEEVAHYQAGFNEALADGDISEDEQDEFAVFLIETDDAE